VDRCEISVMAARRRTWASDEMEAFGTPRNGPANEQRASSKRNAHCEVIPLKTSTLHRAIWPIRRDNFDLALLTVHMILLMCMKIRWTVFAVPHSRHAYLGS
jgi:hypothetical protein